MEGPSLVIAREEFEPFIKRKVSKVEGNTKAVPKEMLKGAVFVRAQSWGKHFLLSFQLSGAKKNKNDQLNLRIHFLMFGSYRINNPRENRVPRLAFNVGKDRIYFYSCAIRPIDQIELKKYDWSVDLMSAKWDHKQAVVAVKNKPDTMVCDILMDQTIFAGLGNIIKNEVLYRLRLHPEKKIKDLTPRQINNLVFEAHRYSHQFYEWKKLNQLKRHWLIMRKRDCPENHGEVIKRPTGKLQRLSHYCPTCQPAPADQKSKKAPPRAKPSRFKVPTQRPRASVH